jgi:hypothetical protein
MTENLPALPEMQTRAVSIFDVKTLDEAKDLVSILCKSDMLPINFRGEANKANLLIALNLANRLGLDPLMLTQNMQIVYGVPGLKSKLMIALINSSGLFDGILQYDENDDDEGSTRAWAINKKTGEKIFGPWVSIGMAKREGWYDRKDKNGKYCSKWRTLPQLMRRYRAASFFTNTICPNVALGLHSVDELQDVDAVDMQQVAGGAYEAKQETPENVYGKGDPDFKPKETVREDEPQEPPAVIPGSEPAPGEHTDENGNTGMESDKEKPKPKVPSLDDLIGKAQEHMPLAPKKDIVASVKNYVNERKGKLFSSLSDSDKQDVFELFDHETDGFKAFLNPKEETTKPPTNDHMIAKIQDMFQHEPEAKEIGKVKRTFARWSAVHYGGAYSTFESQPEIQFEIVKLFDDPKKGFAKYIETEGWGR